MSRFFRPFAILFLSICVAYQGVAIYLLTSGQSDAGQPSVAAQEQVVVIAQATTASIDCCDFYSPHDEQADKENAPVMWEIDTHGSPLHLAHLLLGGIKIPTAEHGNYPSPVYSLHRPPDTLS